MTGIMLTGLVTTICLLIGLICRYRSILTKAWQARNHLSEQMRRIWQARRQWEPDEEPSVAEISLTSGAIPSHEGRESKKDEVDTYDPQEFEREHAGQPTTCYEPLYGIFGLDCESEHDDFLGRHTDSEIDDEVHYDSPQDWSQVPGAGWSPTSSERAEWRQDEKDRQEEQRKAAAETTPGRGLRVGSSASQGPTGPEIADPMQEVRVTEYGKCYHVIGGTCSYCPPDRSTVVTLRMARDSMMLRACGACKVTDEVSRNTAPAGQIYEYDAYGKRNPQFPHKKDCGLSRNEA